MSTDVQRLLSRKTHDKAFRQGQEAMLDDLVSQFKEWAKSHPNPVIADELWGFVDKIREQEMAR